MIHGVSSRTFQHMFACLCTPAFQPNERDDNRKDPLVEFGFATHRNDGGMEQKRRGQDLKTEL